MTSIRQAVFDFDTVRDFSNDLFTEDMHAKRVHAFANASSEFMTSVMLGEHRN